MNKKYYKLLFIVLLLLAFTINVKVFAEEINDNEQIEEIVEEEKNDYYSNSKYELIIEDDANLLSSNEKQMLEEKMRPLLEYGNIAFKSIDNNPYSFAEKYASNYYHSKFQTESGTLFLIDMQTRNIYIFSDGANYRVITKDKAYIITDNIYTYASNERYYQCAYNAFDQIETLLKGGKILEPMRYITNALVSITIGSFIAFYIAIKMTSIKRVTDKELIKSAFILYAVYACIGFWFKGFVYDLEDTSHTQRTCTKRTIYFCLVMKVLSSMALSYSLCQANKKGIYFIIMFCII